MKICSTCKEEKDYNSFHVLKKGESKLRASCKKCNGKRCQDWHNKNKEQVNVRSKKNREARNELARAFIINHFKQNPCAECGDKNLMVLEFDHLGDKEFTIAKLLQSSALVSTIKKEVEKCEVVCASCHRIRTYTRNKSYRYIAEQQRKLENE